jgi:hypothetical protein
MYLHQHANGDILYLKNSVSCHADITNSYSDYLPADFVSREFQALKLVDGLDVAELKDTSASAFLYGREL